MGAITKAEKLTDFLEEHPKLRKYLPEVTIDILKQEVNRVLNLSEECKDENFIVLFDIFYRISADSIIKELLKKA